MKIAAAFLLLSLTCFGQTNHIIAVQLTADVQQADAKCVGLYKKRAAISAQILPLAQRQSERTALHLPIDIGIASQINQLTYQQNIVNQQILEADQWDYQIRYFHHLPRFNVAAAMHPRK
jgi:hypothetical protein